MTLRYGPVLFCRMAGRELNPLDLELKSNALSKIQQIFIVHPICLRVKSFI